MYIQYKILTLHPSAHESTNVSLCLSVPGGPFLSSTGKQITGIACNSLTIV
jgi:hypothetical protein